MVYIWHAVISYSIFAWVVGRLPLPTLSARLPWLLGGTLILAMLDTSVPIIENDLGLRRFSSCYLARTHRNGGSMPTFSILIDKIILLPLCCLLIAFFNIYTVVYMARKARQFGHHDPAVDRLKVRGAGCVVLPCVGWG